VAREAPPEAAQEEESALPPLEVDADAPLLLEGPEEAASPTSEPLEVAAADNQPCFVCHVNYEDETLASGHAAEGIGCVTCHGDSFAHRNDENNTTPPDVIYAASAIDPACGKCHRTHDAPAREVVALWLERCPEKRDPATIVCTDCHGEHRLAVRTVRWNKETRELITD
jgi:hypothetical protein